MIPCVAQRYGEVTGPAGISRDDERIAAPTRSERNVVAIIVRSDPNSGDAVLECFIKDVSRPGRNRRRWAATRNCGNHPLG